MQTQPESSAELRPPTEEPPQGAQATKEDQPPSQENPEVVWPAGGTYPFLALRPGSLQGWDNFIRKLLTGCSCQSRAHPVSCICTLCSLGCAGRVGPWSAWILPPCYLAECQQCCFLSNDLWTDRSSKAWVAGGFSVEPLDQGCYPPSLLAVSLVPLRTKPRKGCFPTLGSMRPLPLLPVCVQPWKLEEYRTRLIAL